EPLADAWAEAARLGVRNIVSLAPQEEIMEKSPDYASAIDSGQVPCAIRWLPIRDYHAPDDENAFRALVFEVANSLRQGQIFLVHCGAGIGRTGMFAVGVLMALGFSSKEARNTVGAAGSAPERMSQEEALRRFERFLDSSCETR